MNIYLEMLLAVILFPVVLLGAIGFWGLVGALLESIYGKINQPAPPYCDINPLYHSTFYWKPDGSGWIGSVKCISQTKQ